MSNELVKVFENEEFGSVRTIIKDNAVWFVGKDVAEALGYAKPENAIANHVDDEDKTSTLIQGSGSNYKSKTVIINESGLYSLVLSSKLPTAKKFKHWVTSEVLPSIRATGSYTVPQTDDEFLAKAVILATKKLQEAEQRLAIAQPKADYLDLIMANNHGVNVTMIAKDYGMSARAFNSLLHEYHIQYKNGNTWVLYAAYADQGYTVSRTTFNDGKGNVYVQTLWTQKGRRFLYDLLKQDGILPLIERENIA